MVKHFGHIVFVCLMLLCRVGASAYEGKLFTADKMSSSTIACVTQDAYGFVWVGTGYGLNRFDGYQFNKYFANSLDSASLISNEVTSFLVDRDERLWVGCRKGIMRYRYEDDTFQRYAFPGGVSPRVVSLVEDRWGSIFIGTSGYGLFVIYPGTDEVVRPSGYQRRQDDDFVGSLFLDDRHNLWYSNLETQFARVAVDSAKVEKPTRFQTDCGPVVSFVRLDQRGFYVVCMYGVLYYDYLTQKLVPSGFNLDALSPGVSLRSACFDHLGNLFLGTSGTGLMVVPRGSRTLQPVSNINASFNLTAANVNSVFEDRSHNLWVSCYKKGLYLMQNSHSAFTSWRFSTQNYNLGSSVSSIAPGTDGDVLCVVQKSGVYRFDPDGRVQGRLNAPDAPTVLYRDHRQRYWLGTENSLYLYDPVAQASRLCMRSDGWGVSCMADDGEDLLFLGIDGKGLCVYDIATGTQHTYSMYQDDPRLGHVVNNWIRALYYDSRGLLWIGSVSGLGCMSPRDGNFKPLGWNIQFKGSQCYSLRELANGNMLIGTEAGLYVYDRNTGEFSLFSGSEEMLNKSIYAIVIDQMGDLWMSTANGIWHYNTRTRKFDSFDFGNGLEDNEYVVGTVITPPDGRIMFGNNDGVTMFYPHEVKGRTLTVGEVFLTSFMVNGRRTDCREKHFEVGHGDNSFVMEFSLLDFRNTDNTTFYYRVNGAADWTPLPEGTHTLSFNGMKPGTYRLDVRAMINGVHSETPCTLTIDVRPPWYSTWWAWLGYVLALTGVLAIVLASVEHRRKQQMEEEKVHFVIKATHDIRSPLTLIMGPLRKLRAKAERMEEGPERAEMEHYMDIIDRNAQRLMTMVNQIIDDQMETAPAPQQVVQPAMPAQRPHQQPSSYPLILLADDEVELAQYVANELGTWYHFDIVSNGKEALELLYTGNYDLVVSDVMMPQMDGIALLKNIKSVPQLSDIPVILLTSKTEVSTRLDGIRNGADSYIAKPFSMEELHAQIDNLISNVRRLRGKYSGALDQHERMEDIEVKGNNDALMERISKVVNENISDPDFNVDRLTSEVGISRAQLHRKMKEITGVSASDFIRNQRMKQAERLIRERKINVTQVAYSVGFNNQSHFSTVFRKYYGMTPSEYAARYSSK